MEAISFKSGLFKLENSGFDQQQTVSLTLKADLLVDQLIRENHKLREELSRLHLFLSLGITGVEGDNENGVSAFGFVLFQLLPDAFSLCDIEQLLDDLGFEPVQAQVLLSVYKSQDYILIEGLDRFKKNELRHSNNR